MTPPPRRPQRLVDNFIKMVCCLLILPMCIIMVLLFGLDLPEGRRAHTWPMIPIVGVIGFGFTYLISFGAARLILFSNDQYLFPITPLTPSRYHRHNFGRHWGGAVAVFAMPLVSFVLMMGFGAEKEGGATAKAVGLALNASLTVLLAALIPYHDARCDAWWTRVFFLPRIMLVDYWRMRLAVWLGFVPLTLGALFGAIDLIHRLNAGIALPWIDVKIAEVWRALGPAADLVHWILSPLSAIASIYARPGPQDGGLFLAGAQAVLVGVIGVRVWRRMTADMNRFSEEEFAQWLEQRDRFEAWDEEVQSFEEQQIEKYTPVNYSADALEDELNGGAPAALETQAEAREETAQASGPDMAKKLKLYQTQPSRIAYEENHGAEAQIVRHRRVWNADEFLKRLRVPWRTWAIMGGLGLATAYFTQADWARGANFDIAAQPIFFLFVLFASGLLVMHQLKLFIDTAALSVMLPMQWPALMRAVYGRTLALFVLYDAVAIIMLALVLRPSLQAAGLLFATLLWLRVNLFLTAALGEISPGRDVLSIHIVTFVLSMMAFLVFIVQFAKSSFGMRRQPFLAVTFVENFTPALLDSFVPPAWLLVQGVCLLLLAPMLAARTRRRGAQIFR